MKDLKDKRQVAIEIPSKRENFITKHCNIVYAGEGTESFVSLEDVRRGKRDKIDWRGKNVYIGVDLSMSNDNCSVAMSAYESEIQGVVCEVIAFLPEDKIEEKNKIERINYYDFIKQCKAIACGDRTVDYAVMKNLSKISRVITASKLCRLDMTDIMPCHLLKNGRKNILLLKSGSIRVCYMLLRNGCQN